MWRIRYRAMSLQDVLVMAYMNVLETKSWIRHGGDGDVQTGIGNATVCEQRHHRQHSNISEPLRSHLP
jgi:hypothetical protein